MINRFCTVKNMPPNRITWLLYGVSKAYGIGPNQASIPFSSITETPMVAISGSSSLPRARNGANTAALIRNPSAAPTSSATPMLAR